MAQVVFAGGGPSRLAISAAAIACLYNAGDYDSKMSDACLAFVDKQFQINANQWSKGGGHDYYTHLYASQAFYQAGDKYWSNYFPGARDQLLHQQARDGSWPGDFVGPVYGTSIALIACKRGLATSGGAEGVGRATTSAVVTSLFAIVVLDAIFTLVNRAVDAHPTTRAAGPWSRAIVVFSDGHGVDVKAKRQGQQVALA